MIAEYYFGVVIKMKLRMMIETTADVFFMNSGIDMLMIDSGGI